MARAPSMAYHPPSRSGPTTATPRAPMQTDRSARDRHDAAPTATATAPIPLPTLAEWQQRLQAFRQPDARRATWQLVTTIGSYVGAWVAMWFALAVSWWLAVPLAVLTGGLMVRVFILFHDCGHGSFFASRRANDFWGVVTGWLTLTPYRHWRDDHATHHGATGDLDRRGIGDIWTMTVQEYHDATPWRRLCYRVSRSPIVLFGVAPFALFLVMQRVARRDASPRERASVRWMNVAVAATAVGLAFAFGLVPYLILQSIVLLVAGAAGIGLFYLQHQYEDAYWERGAQWDYTAAALQGSSFLRLPRVLQWFSGNIGFHHIHHLNPRIPNYHLQRCHESVPAFQAVRPLSVREMLRALRLRLWHEPTRKLVSFRQAKRLQRARAAG